jgi:hypothetical protein
MRTFATTIATGFDLQLSLSSRARTTVSHSITIERSRVAGGAMAAAAVDAALVGASLAAGVDLGLRISVRQAQAATRGVPPLLAGRK